jgi:DNA-3-methyladenine glycosylase
MGLILGADFYARDTVVVAKELVGKILIRQIDNQILSGIIVETEAYRGSDDPASHAYRGITPRSKPMFGPVGHTYIYFVYGTHYCFNITAKTPGQEAGAVLIRAIEPLEGIDLMKRFRGKNKHIADGPGKLCQAMQIDKRMNALSLMQRGDLYLINTNCDKPNINATGRIGISQAVEHQWRFIVQ